MKKQLITILAIILLILGVTFSVNAADATANLKASNNNLNPGETFKVTFEASCEEGINGINAVISYDTDKLEVVSPIAVTDTSKWVKIEGETDLTANILSNGSAVKSGEVFSLTFKVKENAERGTTAKITASEIYIDGDGEGSYNLDPSEIEVSIKEEVVTLSSIEITKAPTKTTYNAGEKFDKTGMKVTAKYSDGTSKEVTNYTYTPTEALKTSDTKVTVSYTEDGVTKTAEQKITVAGVTSVQGTSTESKKEMPYTGTQNIIMIVAIAIIGAVSVVSYIKYRQYKNI